MIINYGWTGTGTVGDGDGRGGDGRGGDGLRIGIFTVYNFEKFWIMLL
jgi:hypothetical protein